MIKLMQGDCLEMLKTLKDNSVDMCITSPPYWKLRDYGASGQLGQEPTFYEYIDDLFKIFEEIKRVLKNTGSLWVNIADVYAENNKLGIKKQSLIGIPERLKIKMIDAGWLCRNEVIWHKPNAMPCSAKTRFNNDYEKLFFFTKQENYFFNTQYEPAKSCYKKTKRQQNANNTKYENTEQEASVRQGMSKDRGSKLIIVRNKLPEQKVFVDFIRTRTTVDFLEKNTNFPRTKIEHWFRRDLSGFAYPSIEDWEIIKDFVNDWSKEFEEINVGLTEYDLETDDINKNIDRGRIKRAVWSINTKASKYKHFASYPEELVVTPIKATCPDGGVVLDCFMGSGTTGAVAKKMNKSFIGIELNEEYFNISKKRIEEI